MHKNEHECPNININAKNWALMTKIEHSYPTFEHFFRTLQQYYNEGLILQLHLIYNIVNGHFKDPVIFQKPF